MNVITQDGAKVADTVGVRKVDAMRGGHNSTVSKQWFSRPEDEKYTNLNDLVAALNARTIGTREDVVVGSDVRLISDPKKPDDLHILGPDSGLLAPTNHVFQQMCGLVGAPYSYLKGLPAFLAGTNLQYGFSSARDLGQMLYWNEQTREARAFTGENYGRIMDAALAEAVQKIAGDGVGETCWKVPGLMNWHNSTYNPYVDVTKQTTTLFASDRDVFMFLCDDTHPIEIGKLRDGSPDLVFRGFYAWNSEVGSRSLGIATFLMRGACANRCLWGVEGFEQLTFRHSRFAPDRFARDLLPTLNRYANSGTNGIVAGIATAKAAIVAKDDDDRKEFLGKRAFTKAQIQSIMDTVEREEGKPAESVWDFVNGITAVARNIPNTDARLDMERRAGDLMSKTVRGRA